MYYSEQKKQINVQNRRTFFLFIGKLSLFSIVGWKLFNIQILNSAKYGVWSLHHGDNDQYRGLTPGFWEVYNNEPTTGVTLQILNNTLDGGSIIDKGYFGSKFFCFIT